MLSEIVHQGILRKFEALKGETLIGRIPIKGVSKEQRVPADQFVEEDHILHDLIRGFYKPAGMHFLISYQGTESVDNYGQQIIWENKARNEFKIIEIRPPSRPKDNRKKSDIAAARYNLHNQIPIGILHKVDKGINVVLGLGMIVEENSQGIFIVKPYPLNEGTSSAQNSLVKKLSGVINDSEIDEDLVTEVLKEIKQRKGQAKFRKLLLSKYKSCAICGVEADYSRASHIKPWAVSNDHERLDINNGLLLCPNHDYLFDKGLITFKENGEILISSKLSAPQQTSFNVNSMLRIQMSNEMKKYMAHHQIEFKK